MTREEFRRKAAEIPDWAPGWDAIDQEFERLYSGQEPAHFGTDMRARAVFGGDQYLDGYSLFQSTKGYLHLVTYGMTELYAKEEMLGAEWNRWGYEMTMKIRAEEAGQCVWAIGLMAQLARYTYQKSDGFSAERFLGFGGQALDGGDSRITALLFAADTEARTQESIYGKTEFLQLVGITQPEFLALKRNPERVPELMEKLKAVNPDLVTDMGRTESLIV